MPTFNIQNLYNILTRIELNTLNIGHHNVWLITKRRTYWREKLNIILVHIDQIINSCKVCMTHAVQAKMLCTRIFVLEFALSQFLAKCKHKIPSDTLNIKEYRDCSDQVSLTKWIKYTRTVAGMNSHIRSIQVFLFECKVKSLRAQNYQARQNKLRHQMNEWEKWCDHAKSHRDISKVRNIDCFTCILH